MWFVNKKSRWHVVLEFLFNSISRNIKPFYITFSCYERKHAGYGLSELVTLLLNFELWFVFSHVFLIFMLGSNYAFQKWKFFLEKSYSKDNRHTWKENWFFYTASARYEIETPQSCNFESFLRIPSSVRKFPKKYFLSNYIHFIDFCITFSFRSRHKKYPLYLSIGTCITLDNWYVVL